MQVHLCWHFSWYWRLLSSMISKLTITPKLWTSSLWHTAYLFTPKHLSGVRGRGTSTGEYRRGNSPAGRPHWSVSLSFQRAPTPEMERSPGRPLPSAASCRLTRPTSRGEFAGLSVWQPHTNVNTQRGKRVLSLGGLFCGASGARPPSLGSFLWGFPFSALDVPRGDHTLKDSQQSVVHHETGTIPRTRKRQVSHSALYSARKAAIVVDS